MRLYITGQEETDILIQALCEYFNKHENETAFKILRRALMCSVLQNRQSKKKAVAPQDND